MQYRITAALLVCWYLFSVVGFDVHRCADSDNVYVESLVAGISCEDIHPDVPCHHHHHSCNCCSGCHEDEECDCQNTIGRLEFPGVSTDDGVQAPMPAMVVLTLVTAVPAPAFVSSAAAHHQLPSNGPPAPDLSFLCVFMV